MDGSDESSSICCTYRKNTLETSLFTSGFSVFPRFCTRDQFSCKSSKLCIPKSNICDTISQCHDRSDEMFCTCPVEDYLSRKLFYRCGLTNKCLPKNIECHLKRQCHSTLFPDDDDDDEIECPALNQTCSMNKPCLGKNQFMEQDRKSTRLNSSH